MTDELETKLTSTIKDWDVNTSGNDEAWTCDKPGFENLRIVITQDLYGESPREWSNQWKWNLDIPRHLEIQECDAFTSAEIIRQFVLIQGAYLDGHAGTLRELLYDFDDLLVSGDDWGAVPDADVLAYVRKGYPVEKFLACPIYAYIHSGIALSTGRGGQFSDLWDSGVAGFAFLDIDEWCKEYGIKREEFDPAEAYKNLDGEVKTYNQYLSGDVWGVVVERKEKYVKVGGSDEIDVWEMVESCGGFYGSNYALTEAVAMVNYEANNTEA